MSSLNNEYCTFLLDLQYSIRSVIILHRFYDFQNINCFDCRLHNKLFKSRFSSATTRPNQLIVCYFPSFLVLAMFSRYANIILVLIMSPYNLHIVHKTPQSTPTESTSEQKRYFT